MSRFSQFFTVTQFQEVICLSLILSDHLYSEQIWPGIDALLTPVKDPSDALKIKLSRNFANRVLLNSFLLRQNKGT